MCFFPFHHNLLLNLNYFWWQLYDLFHRHQSLNYFWNLNNSVSVPNKFDHFLMSLWNDLILGNKNRVIFFDNLIDCLFYQFFLDDRDSNRSLSLHHFLHYFFNYYLNWFYLFLDGLYVPNIIFYNLMYLQLFLNHNFVLSWNMYRPIFLNYHFHPCRDFYCFSFLYYLVHWHLTILCVDHRFFNIVVCLHRNLFYDFNWIIVSHSNTDLVVDHFCLRNRNYFGCWLINDVFLRNSYNIIDYFLDVFGYFYNFGRRSEHTNDWIDFIEIDNLSLDHSKNSFI